MSGKVMIYGGSGGIGSALAAVLRSRGYALHLVGRNEAALDRVAAEHGATSTVGDVTDDGLFERAAEEAGPSLAGLAYAVGTINLGSLSRLSPADYAADFRVNAMGAALAVRAALSRLKAGEGPGSVVLFSSVAASQGFPMHASIGMAKGAVNGLTLSLAAELAPEVRVNAIAPSLTRTPLAGGILKSEAMAKAIAGLHPLPRLGAPEDIAALAAFLLGPESGWMTGQVIGVDGGRSTLRLKS